MKSRLTLTVDPMVSHRAKEIAHAQGMSLSALVEKLLAEAAGRPPIKVATPFSRRWRGKMKVSQRSDKRTARLRAKFKLNP